MLTGQALHPSIHLLNPYSIIVLKGFIIFISCVCVSACMYAHVYICKYLQVLEEGFRSSGARVMDSYEQPSVDTGN